MPHIPYYTMLSNVHEKKAVWWLFQTFPPVRARAERVDVKKVAPSAEPGQRFKIKDYLRVTIDKDWLILPPGAFIGLHSQDKQDDDLREEELSLDVSCDFLELKALQQLLGGMQPQGLSHEDTEKVLKLLNTLGIVVWIDEAKLRDTVMLNPRQVAVAMANLIAHTILNTKTTTSRSSGRLRTSRKATSFASDPAALQHRT